MIKDKKKRESFISAYEKYYPVIFHRIFKSIGIKEDVEDICHDVFIELYNKLEDVNEPIKWLMTVTRNQIALYYRKKNVKSEDSIDLLNLEENKSISVTDSAKETRILLSQEIENADNYSDETDRILFELIAIFKYSYKEAALQLGLTRRQIVYRYKKIINKMIINLRSKGIINIKDIL
jgi:RNA polymerase sigma factor (sigma-70 family)